ncbi:MAG TPA: chromate transporter [Candidatus Syntrophosphaera sp.]|jgi:chromate transporter|nr:chromate transporter [Candidatus Cloacimonadota bacterium]HNU54933.1 chromate transporter [Candidatus Syntrophosphaera sp.]MDI9525301.1 chromate transporter [Candidatus Cloacimonadota bacterium]NLH93862.1 chromate transporter [Candidatus Cloacimonadota bacterium]HOH48816.1 chromate transporter [Candidatus Syntrophosphaera sp.]
MTWLTLFWTFVKIGLFSFGGGYAVLAMIQQEVVVRNAWLTQSEFTDVVAISQMTPGPIAINSATFIGYRQGGVLGSLVCTFGVILPSLVLMLVITLTYLKLREQPWFKNIFQKLRWLTLGLIGAAMVLIAKGAFTDWFTVLVFVISLAIYWKFKTNPIYLMLGAAVFGMVFG